MSSSFLLVGALSLTHTGISAGDSVVQTVALALVLAGIFVFVRITGAVVLVILLSYWLWRHLCQRLRGLRSEEFQGFYSFRAHAAAGRILTYNT